jgi:hypothetical protein
MVCAALLNVRLLCLYEWHWGGGIVLVMGSQSQAASDSLYS